MSSSTEKRSWVIPLTLGALWGLSEVLLYHFLKGTKAPFTSPFLAAVAMGYMAAGWKLFPRWWTPFAMGAVAAICKLSIPELSHCFGGGLCKGIGAAGDGLAFGLVVLAMGYRRTGFPRVVVASAVAAVLGLFIISCSLTYIAHTDCFGGIGLARIGGYVLSRGSYAMIFSAITAALAWKIAGEKRPESAFRPALWRIAGLAALLSALLLNTTL